MPVVLVGTRIARFATAAVAIGVLLAAAVWSGLGSAAFVSTQDASMKVKGEDAMVAMHLENRKLKQRLQERTRVTSELAKSLAAGLFWCFANCWVQRSALDLLWQGAHNNQGTS